MRILSQSEEIFAIFAGLIDVVLALLSWILFRLERRCNAAFRETDVLRQEVAKLRESAEVDPLTGLKVKRLFDSDVALLLRDEQPLTLLYIDLDGLKAVNTAQGHQAGDAWIGRGAKAILRAIRRGSDRHRIYRRGGAADEFLLLLPGASLDVGVQIAGQILVALNGEGIGASIGVATSTERMSAADLERAAELAMEWAKKSGKNCVRPFHRPGDPVPVEIVADPAGKVRL